MIKISIILLMIMTIANLLLYMFTRDVAFLFFGTWTLLAFYHSLNPKCTIHVRITKDGEYKSMEDNRNEGDSDRN